MTALRSLARLTAVVATAGTLTLLLQVGARTPPWLLGMFIVWDLAPFVAFILNDRRTSLWPAPRRTALYAAMLFISVATLAVYYFIANAQGIAVRPAAVFLVAPVASWLLLAVALWSAGAMSRN